MATMISATSGRAPRGKKGALSPQERNRKIKAIRTNLEAKKRELGIGDGPSGFRRGPVFYLGLVAFMAILGLSVIKATESGGTGARVRTGKIIMATKSIDAFAEALGRFKFHTGVYPTAEEGLQALVDKFSKHDGWVGPYIHAMRPDPWKNAYVYEPPSGTNTVPVLLSMGPDGVRGTADDIRPEAQLFSRPFRDTTWTNDWAPFYQRGIIVVPSKTKQEVRP